MLLMTMLHRNMRNWSILTSIIRILNVLLERIPISDEEHIQLKRDIKAHIRSWEAYRHLPESNPGGRVLALMELNWPYSSENLVVYDSSELNNNK